ncbi:MAG: phosphonate metabolism transcriptional regulator PhnF [Pelagimonas sp.]|jgi:GntR family phosphonate transport system transcriptional regulator|nr:phosphonate metabolism transcriptional regulator PhnF [Pelagimonas sp.]
MARSALWKTIAQALTEEIGAGQYAPGDKLPTEAQLSGRFGVNRHTVRRALAHLQESGLVISRRGAGVYVASTPTDYALGQRVRFNQNLRAAGKVPNRQILSSQTRMATPQEAQALHIAAGDTVHVCDTLAFADAQPITLGRGIYPAAAIPDLIKALHRHQSVTAALKDCGVADYTRAWTRINAKQADATQALHLRIQEGAPVLRTTSVNVDPDGTPIEFGTTWFVGDRVTLTLES